MVEVQVAPRPAAAGIDDQDDWFGEGSVFESGEQLAAALLAMAEPDAGPAPAVAASVAGGEVPDAGGDADLVVFDRSTRPVAADAVPRPHPRAATALTWGVRVPGAVEIPPRIPGKSGWSIRNSVQMLRRTEKVMLSLREDALQATLMAAARTLHPAKERRNTTAPY